jgi:hypothetical protein
MLTAALLVLGLNLFWCWAFAGPFRWIALWQLQYFRGYVIQLTLLASLLLSGAATLALLLLLARFGAFDRFGPRSNGARRPRPWLGWCLDHPVAVLGTAAGLGCVAVGCYHYVSGRTAGPLLRVDAAQVEAGEVPASRWVEVQGELLPGSGVKETKGGREVSNDHFFPLVSAKWKRGEPVALVARVPARLFDPAMRLATTRRDLERYLDSLQTNPKPFWQAGEEAAGKQPGEKREPSETRLSRGMLSHGGLPGLAEIGLQQSGYRLAPDYLVLDCGQDPQSERNLGKILLAIGAVVLAATGIGSVVSTTWSRRRAARLNGPGQSWPGEGFVPENASYTHVRLGEDGKGGIMFW